MTRPTLAQQFLRARQAGTPLVAVTTSDPRATIAALHDAGALVAQDDEAVERSVEQAQARGEPVEGLDQAYLLRWDVADGVVGVGLRSSRALKALADKLGLDYAEATATLPAALAFARSLPPDSVLFVVNYHRGVEGDSADAWAAVQAISNLRDDFKSSWRTLVLMGPHAQLPVELQGDVVVMHDDLPDDARVAEVVREVVKGSKLTQERLSKAVLALRGLPAFAVEQSVSMSLTPSEGIDLESLWRHKREAIAQVDGLSVMEGPERFDDLYDLDGLVDVMRKVLAGPKAPAVVVFMDEIEKQMAGADSDSSGTAQDKLNVLLQATEDNDWTGFILFGVPGAGKTHVAKALANESNALALKLDLGATSHKHVGESERKIRRAVDTLKAVGGRGRVLFVATCNQVRALKSELKRRFRFDVWVFDLPSPEGLKKIWAAQLKRYDLDSTQPLPDHEGWSGSNVRNCCDNAQALGVSVVEASRYVVPTVKSDPTTVDDIRGSAHNRFIDAATGRAYVKPSERAPETRDLGRRAKA